VSGKIGKASQRGTLRDFLAGSGWIVGKPDIMPISGSIRNAGDTTMMLGDSGSLCGMAAWTPELADF
jgi:hypothetical protein